MTLNFYVSYLVPVKPEKVQEIEQEIARIEQALAAVADTVTFAELQEKSGNILESHLARLRAQMEPERRRQPAIQESRNGIIQWFCPRPECRRCIGTMRDGVVDSSGMCVSCGAEVHKEELPMSLDLFRMRTRRTDGVEIQGKPPTPYFHELMPEVQE